VVRRLVPGLTSLLALLAALLLVGALPAAPASDPGWSAYHHDPQRTGVDPTQGTALSVSAGWTSPALDGKVYAEPLVNNGHVIVATEGNTVYSLNAGDGTVVWSQNLGPPVVPTGFPCGNINPIGITSTPVIDPTSGVVYAVAFLAPLHHELFALSLSTGAVLWHRTIDAPGADPQVHNQRGALALSQGNVYVPFGGLAGDCGQYQGRVVASPVNGTGALLTYTVPTTREGGIWGPAGPAVDPATGDLLVATGNSNSTTTFDYGESVIRLSPSLSVLDYWVPSNWVALNQGDVDIGSVGPTILGNNRIFQTGKAGVAYLLAADHLGGIGGQVFSADVCAGGGVFGGTAYAAPYIYVPCNNGLAAVLVAPDGNSFSVAWRGPSGNAGPPIVSGGLVWTLYPGKLEAFNATTGAPAYQATVSEVATFSTPSSGDGQVFVAANGGVRSFVLTSATLPGLRRGYWLAASDGGIFNYGDAGFSGSAGGHPLNQPIVGMAATPSGGGYWLAASDGGIFNYGDAGFFGSAGSVHLHRPIVGMAPTPSGGGYWLAASDGGIFNYGDAGFSGSAGGHPLNQPIVGMSATPSGGGYWLVASDGGIFAYGNAAFFGSTGSIHLNQPIVGMAATPDGQGYWLVASDGGIFNYGDAGFFGSGGALHLNKPIVGMAATPDGHGYWLVASDGGIFNYGDAGFFGSAGALHLNKPIVGMAP
jgi:outer membrane protein assembly factor BamB